MSTDFSNEFTNRELEVRDPKKLLIVTKDHLEKYPDRRDLLAKYYDKRADSGLDEGIAQSVKSLGYVHTPVFITTVDMEGTEVEVVVAGRQRVRAAIAAGLAEVPVISHSNEDKINAVLEATENLSRRQNTPAESAHVYKKLLQTGMTQDEIAVIAGVTPASISYALSIGEMPKIVHQYIESGRLSPTAALSLKKTFGKKAPKQAGVSTIYDEKEVKAGLEAMDEASRLSGGLNEKGAKIKVKQANNSKANFAEGLTSKEWDALLEDSTTPDDYAILISLFRNKISLASAQRQLKERDMSYEWLRKIVPQPKEKKVKEPKVKASKKEPKVEPSSQTDSDLKALFT